MVTLTAESKREKPLLRLLSKIVTKAHMITLWLIIVSILGLLALPLLDRNIRFDEKGLLAGLAHATVGQTSNMASIDIHRISRAAGGAAFKRPGAAAALAAELRHAGLTETQLTRPTVFTAAAIPCRCANVHTIIRAARGDGLESLALVTPIAFSHQRADSAHDGRNQTADAAQMALMAAATLTLHMARGHVAGAGATSGGGRWLARDLLWVVPDLSCGGYQCLEAWIRQYYEDVAQMPARSPAGSGNDDGGVAAPAPAAGVWQAAVGLHQGQGHGNPDRESHAGAKAVAAAAASVAPMIRAGVIQQAVVLEALAGASYDTSELLVVGHNGLLPKLDMYYLLKYTFNFPFSSALWRSDRLSGSQRALATWLESVMPDGLLTPHALRSYSRRLLTGLQFSWHQAVGLPSASHAAFKDFMVDAATVRLIQRNGPSFPSGRVDEQQLHHRALILSSSLELTLRSLNNLVERVHHSSFLYVLTDHDRYVSVERYVLPAVALAVAIQLQAAWSMAAIQRLLSTPPGAAPKPPTAAAPSCLSTALVLSQSHIWAVAAARAAARTAVLTALACCLRALACDPRKLGWLLQESLQGGFGWNAATAAGSAAGRASGGLVELAEATVATVQSLLAQPLTTGQGLLAAAAVLLGAAVVALAVTDATGRLAGAASAPVTTKLDVSAKGKTGWRKHNQVSDTQDGVPSSSLPSPLLPLPLQSPLPPPASSGDLLTDRKVSVSKEGREEGNNAGHVIDGVVSEPGALESALAVHMAAVATWHAERVFLLTAAATAMTALVCLNWAAAVVAGVYLAPLALWQGLTVRQAVCVGSSIRRRWAGPLDVLLLLLKAVVWLSWNPLIFLVLIYGGASAAGIAAGGLSSSFSGSMVQLTVNGMSTVNYWFVSVVAMSFWLFGVGRVGKGLLSV
ncbi:hypothetical protein VaNZ11_002103 [Volvox africanus]|uniref:Uncharacterized protein n=1 Tax=Volvox africanus TaxID=51714 RepID=A0ABQ5RR84_9CHLO|nr:hypothetical protein VaNZ11_002103 [Volvox africanus]